MLLGNAVDCCGGAHARLSIFVSALVCYAFSTNVNFLPLAEEIKPVSEPSSPSIVVITRPTPHYTTPQPVTIDLSKASTNPLTNGGTTTIFNLDESQASLNLSTESSGYVSNSTTSSLNQSGSNVDDIELEKSALMMEQRLLTPIQSTFNALPMPTSVNNGRRRTISSNSNR